MKRNLALSARISRQIGQRNLSREALVGLFARIHTEIVAEYPRRRRYRVGANDGRFYSHVLAIKDGAVRHLFTFVIDDTTSDERLIINSIHHTTDRSA